MSGDRPPQGAELVSLFHPHGRKAWGGPGGLTHFDAKSLRGKGKYSCEKPLDLMLSLVSFFCPQGGAVLDCVCGAGTTGTAAEILGRDAVLCDASATAFARTLGRRYDRERVDRWHTAQLAWLSREAASDTAANRARRAWAEADAHRVAGWLRLTGA